MNLNEQLTNLFSSSLQEMNESDFVKIAGDYPYCSIAQFNLSQHLKNKNSPDFEKQILKTTLFFNNIPWLKWQINQTKKENDNAITVNENIINEPVSETIEPIIILDPVNETVPEKFHEQYQQQEFIAVDNTEIISPEESIEEELIAFEPLHTIDYFASQGIKITEEPLTNDKLGSQMKSFTDWLKSMKKINAQKVGDDNEQTDLKIQNIAEHSLAHTDVLTEAMAQILIKQNKKDKAIGMYEKLSLINPTKKAYFAAKIESLKSA